MLNVDCSRVPDSCRDLMVLCESVLKKAAAHSSACADDQNLHRSLSLLVQARSLLKDCRFLVLLSVPRNTRPTFQIVQRRLLAGTPFYDSFMGKTQQRGS